MSHPGASGRHRQHRDAPRPASSPGRPLLAVTVVLLIGVPIGWVLFHQPQSGGSDAAIHYVTRDDDRYVTPVTDPAEDTKTPVPPGSPTPSPSRPTGTPTPSPSSPPTPGESPSASPTGTSTAGPTSRPSGGPSNSRLSVGPTTAGPDGPPDGPSPTDPATDGPGPEQTSPPPDEPEPPEDTGSMTGAERELFSMIDNARAERGCAPLRPNSGLTGSARDEAKDRAADDELNNGGSRSAAAGGTNWSATDAYNAMMRQNSGTVLNCGLHQLGVGRGSAPTRECVSEALLFCLKYRTADRVSWVTKFN